MGNELKENYCPYCNCEILEGLEVPSQYKKLGYRFCRECMSFVKPVLAGTKWRILHSLKAKLLKETECSSPIHGWPCRSCLMAFLPKLELEKNEMLKLYREIDGLIKIEENQNG